MANIQVSSSGNAFKIVVDGIVKNVPKEDITFSSNLDYVMISLDGDTFLNELYTDFTIPSAGNAEALRTALSNLRGNLDVTATTTAESAATGTRTVVAFGTLASESQLVAANTNRIGLLIYNNTDAVVQIGLGDTVVTDANFSFELVAGAFYDSNLKITTAIRGLGTGTTVDELIITELT